MTLPVAILAGGLSTRLRPITEKIPKALVEVAGRPFIYYQLELLRAHGIERVVLCVGYLGEMLQEVLGNGEQWQIQIDYSFDGDKLLGTAGALKKALPLLGDAFYVLYGDAYLNIDYQAVGATFLASKKAGLMTVFHNEGRWDRSNIEYQENRIVAYDKHHPTPEMNYIDYGLGVLSREAFALVPEGQAYDLADLYQALIAQQQMASFLATERFYEVGSPTGLAETDQYFSQRPVLFSHQPEDFSHREERVMSYTENYLAEATCVISQLDTAAIDRIVEMLVKLRAGGGRLFFLGVGGSAGNASHAVNDFRKIANIEAYTPTDNVSELTARVNDDGWESVFANWLKVSRLQPADMIFVFSVGGGDLARNISPNLVRALEYAREIGAKICGVVGRDGGFTAQVADACVIIPTVNNETVTPHTEAFQALVWHLLVSHPKLCAAGMKWESVR